MALAESGIRRKFGIAGAVLLVLSSLVPNVDYLAHILGPDSYMFAHRTATHSLIGVFLLVSALAFLFGRFSQLKQPAVLFGLASLGAGLHLLLDLLNPWGIALLYPFSSSRFSLDWVSHTDFLAWVLPAAGLLAGTVFRREAEKLNRSFLVFLAGYFLLCGGSRALAKEQFRVGLLAMGTRYERMAAYPQFSNPMVWNVIASAQGRYFQGFVHSFRGLRGRVKMFFEIEVPRELSSPFVRKYKAWAGAPLVRLVAGGPPPNVIICDLRFITARGTVPYAAKIEVVPPGVPQYRWLGIDEVVLSADAEFELPRSLPGRRRL